MAPPASPGSTPPLVRRTIIIAHQWRRGCRIAALLDQVERVEVPELGGAAQLAAVEAERVESCSTGWSTAAQTGRGVLTVSSRSLSRLRSGAGER
jgi:hypothetical protein